MYSDKHRNLLLIQDLEPSHDYLSCHADYIHTNTNIQSTSEKMQIKHEKLLLTANMCTIYQ